MASVSMSNNTIEFRQSGDPEIKIYCEGHCPGGPQEERCGLEGVLSEFYQCTCNNCKMVVTEDGIQRDPAVVLRKLSGIDLHLDDLNEHIQSKFNTLSFIITLVEVQLFEDGYAILYVYQLDSGVEESVMYAASNQGPKTEIDCTGTCDCRERYIRTQPPTFECTCNECKMTITEINE